MYSNLCIFRKKSIFLCKPFKNKNKKRFVTKWGWGNDDWVFIFEWTIPLRVKYTAVAEEYPCLWACDKLNLSANAFFSTSTSPHFSCSCASRDWQATAATGEKLMFYFEIVENKRAKHPYSFKQSWGSSYSCEMICQYEQVFGDAGVWSHSHTSHRSDRSTFLIHSVQPALIRFTLKWSVYVGDDTNITLQNQSSLGKINIFFLHINCTFTSCLQPWVV